MAAGPAVDASKIAVAAADKAAADASKIAADVADEASKALQAELGRKIYSDAMN